MYAYNAQRLLVPATWLLWLCWELTHSSGKWPKRLKSFRWQGAAFVTQLLLLIVLLTTVANARAKSVFILNQPEYHNLANETVYRAAVSGFARFSGIHALPTTALTDVAGQYFLHLQPDFLFFGRTLGARHSFEMYGLILPVFLPFLLWGLWRFKDQRFDQLSLLMVSILLITPAISALTNDVPHSGRTLAMVVPLIYLVVIGLQDLAEQLKKNNRWSRVVMGLVVLAILGNTTIYLRDLYLFYPEQSVLPWQGQMANLYDHIKNSDQTELTWHIDIDEDPRIFMAWYGKLAPDQIRPEDDPQSLEIAGKRLIIRHYSDLELEPLFVSLDNLYLTEYQENSLAEQYQLNRVSEIEIFDRFHPDKPFYAVYRTGP